MSGKPGPAVAAGLLPAIALNAPEGGRKRSKLTRPELCVCDLEKGLVTESEVTKAVTELLR